MPASALAAPIQELLATTTQIEQSLYEQYPDDADILHQILLRQQFSSTTKAISEQSTRSILSQEEVASILQKLRDVGQLPYASFDSETLLYLEQQLADILGFEVTSEYENCKLPFSKGIVAALPHIQLSPSKNKNTDWYIPEAGSSSTRSYFGWESTTYNQTSNATFDEDNLFWIAFPLSHFKKNFLSVTELKNWWKSRRMVLINPTDAIAIVAQVKDSFFDTSNKYQFGASPTVIREGMFWSPKNAGKSFIFFITDTNEQVASGKYMLY